MYFYNSTLRGKWTHFPITSPLCSFFEVFLSIRIDIPKWSSVQNGFFSFISSLLFSSLFYPLTYKHFFIYHKVTKIIFYLFCWACEPRWQLWFCCMFRIRRFKQGSHIYTQAMILMFSALMLFLLIWTSTRLERKKKFKNTWILSNNHVKNKCYSRKPILAKLLLHCSSSRPS